MIEITAQLFTREDIILAANFQAALLEQQAAAFAFTSTPVTPEPEAPQYTSAGKPVVETTTGPLTAEAPTSAPALVTDTPPDEATVIAAVRTAATAKGTPFVRALLDKYSATRAGDVKASDLLAFLAELGA